MLKLKVEKVSDGLHRSEVVVSVNTRNGEEGLVIDRRNLQDGFVTVGYPIQVDGDAFLVELPRETYAGNWRVWVDRSQTAVDERDVA